MNINWIDVIGIAAGVCTTAAVIPQLIKAYKTKKVADVSIGMFLVLITGVLLWTVYGFLKNDLAIILANGISVVLNSLLLYLLLKHGKKSTNSPNN
ncbi:SemiSWEET family sugar transporter [Owenweeksia hongkongensis]|uniref:MtN3 and saliva related transmembrane protein n=1 Tax=Owenweeksia hongkongensis (strain DSM 17368 / CIP 108786 / JCM 12287 / NRRL B-23963 / UST20020801) TaxID=926562 RepID=G8R4M5_OWEHD|nr:SemiSWEET transporter [Owenweeksia hongkongensis]AEV32114.1 hypothetical protein Oweho_1108 [Owenweeksia hongkongensis DSM 17368]